MITSIYVVGVILTFVGYILFRIVEPPHSRERATVKYEGERGITALMKIISVPLLWPFVAMWLVGVLLKNIAPTIWTWLAEPP